MHLHLVKMTAWVRTRRFISLSIFDTYPDVVKMDHASSGCLDA